MQFRHNNVRRDTMNVPTTLDAGVRLGTHPECQRRRRPGEVVAFVDAVEPGP
jgi:hypothetical protein